MVPRISSLVCGLGLVASVLAAPRSIPGAYIIEYTDGYSRSDVLPSDAAYSVLNTFDSVIFRGISVHFDNASWSSNWARQAVGSTAIKNLWPVELIHAPGPDKNRAQGPIVSAHDDLPTGHATQQQGQQQKQEQGQQLLEKRGVPPPTNIPTSSTSPLAMIQADRAREAGFTGAGVKIAIIDTGVDYLHPALGGCFGPGCLVSYGDDLVRNTFDSNNSPKPGSHPLDTCNGHGSHVAGILGTRRGANPFGLAGAAEGAQLGVYRVTGCCGPTRTDFLMSAFVDAFAAGSDLITCSIASPSGWTEDPWSVVVSRVVTHGVPCLVAAGNDGALGLFYPSSGANGKGVAAVGSVNNAVSTSLSPMGSYRTGSGPSKPFAYGVSASHLEWVNVSLPLSSRPEDGCAAYEDSTPDLADHILLIRPGTCSILDQVVLAMRTNVQRIIFTADNFPAGELSDLMPVPQLRAIAWVGAGQGKKWLASLARGDSITVTMTDPALAPKMIDHRVNNFSGGHVSTSSSWGPTYELDVKPQFLAPGGGILSTIPRAMGSYALASGTSMACPYAAAAYALLMQARPAFRRNPPVLEALLSSTARPRRFFAGADSGPRAPVSPWLAPVPQQGAGLIQVYDAIRARTLLLVVDEEGRGGSVLSFNDSAHFVPTRNFSIANQHHRPVTYRLAHLPAATAYTFVRPQDLAEGSTAEVDDYNTTVTPARFPGELAVSFADLAFSVSGKFTLDGGETRVIGVTVTPPQGLNPDRLPIYSGYVSVVTAGEDEDDPAGERSYSLPYLGVVGSMRDAQVLEKMEFFCAMSREEDDDEPQIDDGCDINNENGGLDFVDPKEVFGPDFTPGDAVFLLPPPERVDDTPSNGSLMLPGAITTLTMGTPMMRVDVVPLTMCPVDRDHCWNITSGGAQERWDGRVPPPPSRDTDEFENATAAMLGRRAAAATLADALQDPAQADSIPTNMFGVPSVGQLIESPLEYVPRGPIETIWEGQLNDISWAVQGRYKLDVRVLRIFGDPNKVEDYDHAETEPFWVQYEVEK